MSSSISVRLASVDDADTLTVIINAAYREAGGWTTETHLVGGARAVKADVIEWLTNPRILDNEPILVAEYEEKLVGCIQPCRGGYSQSSKKFSDIAYVSESGKELLGEVEHPPAEPSSGSFGLFGVVPAYQSKGIGKALVNAAMDHIKKVWKCSLCSIYILEQRPELQAWYEKMGFTWDGQTQDFVRPDLLKVPGTKFRIMTKRLLD